MGLNKTELHRVRRELALYRQVLPSLDLKRRQLASELAAERRAHAALQAQRSAFLHETARRLPMAAIADIPLEELVEVDHIGVTAQHLLGARLPVFESVGWRDRPYAFLARPHWVDAAVAALRQLTELDARVEVAGTRVRLLEQATRKAVQRVNLFEQVLVPRSEASARAIAVALGDIDRAALVRAKFAKRRHESAVRAAS